MTSTALKTLLQAMTLEEKAAQLAQIPMSACLGGVSEPTGPMTALNLTPESIALCGSLIADGPLDAPSYAAVVRALTNAHPHHIPPIVMKDVIHGHRTMFPIPLAIGATFDERFASRMARCGAREAAAMGAHVTFSPMVDVVRDPRWGRVMESPGESPTLCAAMGAAMVKGTRNGDPSHPDSLAACIKHYAGYGLSQAGQEYSPIDVSRTELFNTYFPPFEACVKAGADLVMPAFVGVDRVPCVCNGWMLKDILRGRMGFEGVTISDWDDPGQLRNHGVAADLKEAARLCMEGGLDMDMMSFAYLPHLAQLVREGEISEQLIDEACLRVLELKNKLGLFETPVRNDSAAYQQAVLSDPETKKAAFEAAAASCVLLKNENVLPLRPGAKAALVGDHADSRAILGGWTLDADRSSTRTLFESFASDPRITLTTPGDADVILFACGEREQDTGEGQSKTRPQLTGAQMDELSRLSALGKPVVLLLFCGRPLILTKAEPLCSAILNCWFPGSEGADAIRALVMGDQSPSGHLSMTFPRAIGQIPLHHDRLSGARPHLDGENYFNRYIDESSAPLYPFGYGLSYTSFALDSKVVKQTLCAGSPAVIRTQVTNTGSCSGAAVLQVYAHLRKSPLIRPMRQLIAFRRVELAPQETAEIEFELTQEMLMLYDADGCGVAPEGICDLAVGMDADAPFAQHILCIRG
ncbi:MAG: glycoside hydrolase family 3 C-terminal domain-containing protein [Clostridia bacterium]|nr:glycoside hydrolase family 3 C-terminal domain-containing protein [Clostridia bacterium]